MYESITYAELKSLPREQKIEALKELMATCSSQKKIAEKLGVNPPNIYSMISRYIKDDADKKPGKKKNRIKGKGAAGKAAAGRETRQEHAGGAAIAQEVSETDPTVTVQADEADAAAAGLAQETDTSTDGQMPGTGTGATECTVNADAAAAGQGVEAVRVFRTGEDAYPGRQYGHDGANDFLVSIEKELAGEELGSMLAAIGSALLKNTEYRIVLRITEK